MLVHNIIFFLFLFLSLNLEAEDNLLTHQTYGHNNSPNAYTLPQGHLLLGPYVTAYGITDQLVLATSPWLLVDYNSANIALKYGNTWSKDRKYSIQSVYLKSFEGFENNYYMESLRTNFTLTHKKNESLFLHYNLQYEYFFDETLPHSYRREPFNSDAYQLTTTVLIEYITGRFITIQYEFGLHGINYLYPQLIMGTSIVMKYRRLSFQIGLSATGTPISFFSNGRVDASQENPITKESGAHDFAVHPEIQLQYAF